jgi:hypothetical protein
MGINLGRFLGPVATWRIVQTLGEASAILRVEETPGAKGLTGLTRAQFLRATGGAAVAMSILSVPGTALLPSLAQAQTCTGSWTNGTSSQWSQAKRIVEESQQYNLLQEEYRRLINSPTASIDVQRSSMSFDSHGNYASVGVIVPG